MNRNPLSLLCLLTLALALSSCAALDSPVGRHSGVCGELNSRLIFGGSTSNVRQSNIENAELPLEQRNYDKDNCQER